MSAPDMSAAACAGTDLATWFPDAPKAPGSRAAAEQRRWNTRAAVRVCSGCPVRRECLDLAMSSGPEDGPVAHGIWAGINFADRVARADAIRAYRSRQGVS